MHTNEETILIKTIPPCATSDSYYRTKLNCDKDNTRLSRNLIHALLVYYDKAGLTNPLTIYKGWTIKFDVGDKRICLVGRNLPALVCEAAIKVSENNLN